MEANNRLTPMQSDDGMHETIQAVVKHVRCTPENDSSYAYVIEAAGVMGMTLHDTEKTLYVYEAEFGFILPTSKFQVIATTCLINCVAIFVSSPGGTGFCAHISPSSMECSMQEAYEMRKDGLMFADMGLRLKKVFNSIKRSTIRISLVGGWRLADNFATDDATRSVRPGSVTSFSSAILEFINNIFPGVVVDTSRMNQFPGVSWTDRTPFSKLERVGRGQAFRIAAMDTASGTVFLQTTDISDLTTGDQVVGTRVPLSIAYEGTNRLEQMHLRTTFFTNWTNSNSVPQPAMKEVDKNHISPSTWYV